MCGSNEVEDGEFLINSKTDELVAFCPKCLKLLKEEGNAIEKRKEQQDVQRECS
jgi:hypothetical protein